MSLAKALTKQIQSITEFPGQKLLVLTQLLQEYNHLIDTGKYAGITVDDICEEIEKKNVLAYLTKATSGDSDFSMFGDDGPWSRFIEKYLEEMSDLYLAQSGNIRRKWGVEESGLWLLVAWTTEMIQQGSGWHPKE